MEADWLRYQNQGAIRNKPLSGGLLEALAFLPDLGVTMEVFSGGQAPKGSGGSRTGSTRHDHGNAADAFFYKDGRKLDWSNPDDQPLFQQIVSQAKANGVTGFGAGDGYMQPGSMHIGFGPEAVWGAGGKGTNAPGWLREAAHGQPGHIHTPKEDKAIANDAMAAIGKTPSANPASGGTPAIMGGAERDNLSRHIMNEYQPEKASGILGAMFPNMTADRQDRIALALSGLSMNPNLALQSAVRDRMQERSERRKDWMSERKDYNQRNVTIDALRDAGVSENDLQMARANPDYMRALLSQVAQNRMGKAKTPTPYSEQAKIMSDLRNGLITKEQANAALTGGGDSTEADREIDRLESIGIPRDVAIRIKEGVYKTSVDPVTREVTVIDLSSGQPVYKTDEAAPTAPMTTEPAPAQSGPDASDAFGLEGTIKGGINSVSDFVGMGVPFEGVKETQSDFAVLRENLVNDITQGYGQRVPSWLMQNIQNLTPKTGAFSGPEDAQSKLGALERSFQQELTTIRQQLGGPISPQQRQVLTYREAALNAAIGKVTGALGRFGADNGGNKTSSGVTWRIEQ